MSPFSLSLHHVALSVCGASPLWFSASDGRLKPRPLSGQVREGVSSYFLRETRGPTMSLDPSPEDRPGVTGDNSTINLAHVFLTKPRPSSTVLGPDGVNRRFPAPFPCALMRVLFSHQIRPPLHRNSHRQIPPPARKVGKTNPNPLRAVAGCTRLPLETLVRVARKSPPTGWPLGASVMIGYVSGCRTPVDRRFALP